MRKIKYEMMPGVGDGDIIEENDLLHFVSEIPYLFTFNLIPSLEVMNDIFQSSHTEAGMSGGGRWEPFDISREEYHELTCALQNASQGAYRQVIAPNWVKTRIDWHIWAFEHELGVPSKKHDELWRKNDHWEKLKREAQAKGDEELAMKYHLKAVKSGNRLAEFLQPYIEKYHQAKNRR